jgi:hypothetical protein
MSVNTQVVEFVLSCRTKLAEYADRVVDINDDNAEEHEAIMDQVEAMRWSIEALYSSNRCVRDAEGNEVYNFVEDEDTVLEMISDWSFMFSLNPSAYVSLPLRSFQFVEGTTSTGTGGTGGTDIPIGPTNYRLTVDSAGNLVWVEWGIDGGVI